MTTSLKIVHWLPRIICILAVLFISMFALDAFEPGLSLGQQLLHFFMHLIPSFILLGILVLAWKWEKSGGIIFTIIGLVFSVLVFNINYYRNHFSLGQSLLIVLAIAIPFVLVGVLFMVSNRMKKREVLR